MASVAMRTVQNRVSCFQGIFFALLSTAQDDVSGVDFPVFECSVPWKTLKESSDRGKKRVQVFLRIALVILEEQTCGGGSAYAKTRS